MDTIAITVPNPSSAEWGMPHLASVRSLFRLPEYLFTRAVEKRICLSVEDKYNQSLVLPLIIGTGIGIRLKVRRSNTRDTNIR